MNGQDELYAIAFGNIASGVAGATAVGYYFGGGSVTQALTKFDGALGASAGVFAAAQFSDSPLVMVAGGAAVPYLLGNRNMTEVLLLPVGFLAGQMLYQYLMAYLINRKN